MIRTVATICLSLGFILISQPDAQARECGKRDAVIKKLKNKYKEVLQAGGVRGRHAHMELYASPDGKTWTVLMTNTYGVSCIIMHGEAFYRTKPKPVEDPEA